MTIAHCVTCGEYTDAPPWCDDCMSNWDPDPEPTPMFEAVAAVEVQWIEGEPNEDMYFHGIPDYDIFGRPSWET